MAKTLPNWHIASDGKYQYLVDDKEHKMYWLHDDKYISCVDGSESRKGYLMEHDKEWYKVFWYKEMIAYAKK